MASKRSPKLPARWPEIEAALTRYGMWKPQTVLLHRRAALFLEGFDPRELTQAELDKLKQGIVRQFKRNAAHGYLARIRTILRRVYNRDDLVLHVPQCRPAEVLPLTVEQTNRVYAELERRYPAHYAALLLSYDAALRPGEIIGLNVEHVRLEAKELLVPHGKTGMYTVDLTERCVAALTKWMGVRSPASPTEKALFLNQYGKRPQPEHFLNKALKMAASAVGVRQRVYPNLLRAGVATHLLNMNTNPDVVRKHMRHSQIRTTMTYNRTSQEDQKRLVGQALERLRTPALPTGRKDLHREIGEALAKGEMSLGEARSLLATLDISQLKPAQIGEGYA